MTNRNVAILAISCIAVGAIGALYLRPAQERIEYRDREVVRTEVKTRIIHTKDPNGSERTETIIVDTGESRRDTSLSSLKLAKKDWVAGVGVAYEVGEFQRPEYTAHVARRILGPFFVGVSASTDKTVGVQILGEF